MDEGAPPNKGSSRLPQAEPGSRRFAFGRAVLDERSLELHVAGQRITLERKPLEVLLYLIHHAGEVVTKDELHEHLWPGRILTDTTLTGCVSKIRSALGDSEHAVIKTVHGFGYRFVGELRVEDSKPAPRPGLGLREGDHPPLRPQWRLAERLGCGGHGEAWLARHEKTGDGRVFKFALDKEALAALKREITLYRLLHDSLGHAAAVVRIYEWNLEEPPYFIETEYVEGRDLGSWVLAQGGLQQLPLAQRLDLVAQIAEALAGAHSVGVLHKDLKPGNVLVQPGASLRIKLCDFGSGSVLDAQSLDKLGITRLGFTRTLRPEDLAATPLYLAPEVLGGQPFTVRADVYALGVMLYQFAIGDLKKPLTAGWEADLQDELLREDVQHAASGNPERRLGSAGELAERLRTLDERRAARAAAAAAKERAERARRIAEELRRTRVFAGVSAALATAAIAGGFSAYKARNEAMAATASAKAVSDFLIEDVLKIDSEIEKPREASYESLLKRAALRVDKRFVNDVTSAARVHQMLGRRFKELGQLDLAKDQFERAVELYKKAHGNSAEQVLLTVDELATIYGDSGRFTDALSTYSELLTLWGSSQPKDSLAGLMIRARSARLTTFAGKLNTAERELRSILTAAHKNPPYSREAALLFEQWYGIKPKTHNTLIQALIAQASGTLGGNVLAEFGEEYEESEQLLRTTIEANEQSFGKASQQTATSKLGLAFVLTSKGEYAEAERLIQESRDFFTSWLPAKHFYHGLPLLALARLRSAQHRPQEAVQLLKSALATCGQESCSQSAQAMYYWDLGCAYDQLNLNLDAIHTLRVALTMTEKVRGNEHILVTKIRLKLADTLRKAGQPSEAREIMGMITEKAFADVKPNHPALMEWRQLQHLLMQH